MDFRLAAKSFIVKDNSLLILKRIASDVQKPGIWEIPGGRLEPGEDPAAGLKRETKEETGLDIEFLDKLNERNFTRDDCQRIRMMIFLCKALGSSSKVKLSNEHTAYEWIPLSRAKEKLTEFFHEEVDIFAKIDKN